MTFAAVLDRLEQLTNPYVGLRPFGRMDSHLFFGRDRQISELLDRLRSNRLVAVVGLSGSGKSSLVQAGLLPALDRGWLDDAGRPWRIVVTRPGEAPCDRLAAAMGVDRAVLRSSSYGLADAYRQSFTGESLLLVVDQFEELFRYKNTFGGSIVNPSSIAKAASSAASFVRLLLTAVQVPWPIYVVITMRAEYLGDCAEFSDFADVLNHSIYLVPRMTREERKQAIEAPLGAVEMTSALVETLLNEAGDDPTDLPILQHALMRTWWQWHQTAGAEHPIGIEHYEQIGGIRHALENHANDLLQKSPVSAHPSYVPAIFQRLCNATRNNRESRQPAQVSELWDLCLAQTPSDRRAVNEILDLFRHPEVSFLTPHDTQLAPNTFVDITHEALIRRWRQLAEVWLPEEEARAKP